MIFFPFFFSLDQTKTARFFFLCKHISYFDWNKSGISCIETRRRLIFQPCCIYFTSSSESYQKRQKKNREREKMWFQLSIFSLLFFVRCFVHIQEYLRASLAEATPNDNPFVFYSSSSLRSMFCVFDFAFLMLFSLSLSLFCPLFCLLR